MWKCNECGTEGIITSEAFCPHCFAPRKEDVPAASDLGGAEVPRASAGDPHAAEEEKPQAPEWGDENAKGE